MATLVIQHLTDSWRSESGKHLLLEMPTQSADRKAVHKYDRELGLPAVCRLDLFDLKWHTIYGGHRANTAGSELTKWFVGVTIFNTTPAASPHTCGQHHAGKHSTGR